MTFNSAPAGIQIHVAASVPAASVFAVYNCMLAAHGSNVVGLTHLPQPHSVSLAHFQFVFVPITPTPAHTWCALDDTIVH